MKDERRAKRRGTAQPPTTTRRAGTREARQDGRPDLRLFGGHQCQRDTRHRLYGTPSPKPRAQTYRARREAPARPAFALRRAGSADTM